MLEPVYVAPKGNPSPAKGMDAFTLPAPAEPMVAWSVLMIAIENALRAMVTNVPPRA